MTRIGESPPRPDGLPKVTGGARYGDDFELPGMLYGATVRSSHAHAALEAVRWRPERAPEGAVCVTAADLPGPNGVLLIDDAWPILAAEETCHVGEAVALVAAASRLDARRAVAAVEVEYRELPAVVDLDAADRHEPFCRYGLERGDVDAAFADASLSVVEGTYRTGHQEHIYIECQAMTAWFQEDGALRVIGSMQCPYYVHKSLVHAFGLAPERVRVEASAVGGGFGGKEDFPSMVAIHAALLARASGRPVRIAYDRHEDIVGTTKRHPARVRHRTAFTDEGRLRAMEIEVVIDGGAYPTLSSVVLSRAVLHAAGPYRCPNVRVRGRAVRTHTATNGAFRGFGAPQVQFAVERQIDRVARALDLDPLSIRLRNALVPGDHFPTGQVADETTSARACLEKVQEITGFRERWRQLEQARGGRRDGRPARGLGLSLYFHGAGFTGNGERRMRSPVTARLGRDGRLEILTAMVDMGQGVAVVYPQLACEASGLGPDDVTFADPDTGRVPDSGPTVASRTTMVVGQLVSRVAVELAERVVEWWMKSQGTTERPALAGGQLTTADGTARPFREVAAACVAELGELETTLRYEPPETGQPFDEATYQGDAYPTFSWGADVVEVEVDPDSLEVRPQRAVAVCEVGRALHPTLCAGQIEGGTLQAIGWGLLEEMKLEGGRYLNDRMATYIIPTIKDSPRIQVHLLERPFAGGPFGAKGVGELPMDGGAPAVVAAVENATGLGLSEIPATPERLMGALTAAGGVFPK
ncbi:MAG: xanthine dehydrogenase family protein molybdopterin-binding subunit [Thermoanaerobaculia bacterium]|nr:xanthine dehydrogenase family protein molybdopterin-binding subunit [Thermoanaerobaculia bacterium]